MPPSCCGRARSMASWSAAPASMPTRGSPSANPPDAVGADLVSARFPAILGRHEVGPYRIPQNRLSFRTMFIIFLILAGFAAAILILAILLQSGQGGGLTTQFGGGSSSDAFVGGRQAATILHKASWWAGGVFLALCFLLGLMGGGAAPRS